MSKVKNVGKPDKGKPHVRFDEEGLATPAFYSTKRRDYRNNSGILLHGIQRRRSFANNVGSPGRRGTPFAFGFPAKKCKPLPGLFAAGIKKVLQTLTALS